MDKKAAEESLSFLIGLIMVILFLVPLGIYGYGLYKEGNRLDYSLSVLADNVSSLQDNEEKSLLLYTGSPNDYLLIAFDIGDRDFGGSTIWSCGQSHQGRVFDFLWQLEKPSMCGKKPCICFCSITADTLRPGACSSAKCEIVDVDYQLKFVSDDEECEYGPFIVSASEITDIKMQRVENIIGICKSGRCINQEKQEAIRVYEQFLDNYKNCISSANDGCLCDSLDASALPEDYKIRVVSSNGITTIGLLSEEKRLATENINNNYVCEYLGNDDTRDIPILEFSRDEPGEYADGNIVNFYKKTQQVLCIAGKKGNSFDYLRSKQSCSVEQQPEEVESVSLT